MFMIQPPSYFENLTRFFVEEMFKRKNQCSGSVCFWSAKMLKENFYLQYFVTYDFLSLKNDVNVPPKSKIIYVEKRLFLLVS
jgi:hypothetical protein